MSSILVHLIPVTRMRSQVAKSASVGIWTRHECVSGPEWQSGEPGEFPVGRSAPLINWAGRLACFFFFFYIHIITYMCLSYHVTDN